MTAIDRLGFNLKVKTPEGYRGCRIAFPREIEDPAATRAVMVEMVRGARERA